MPCYSFSSKLTTEGVCHYDIQEGGEWAPLPDTFLSLEEVSGSAQGYLEAGAGAKRGAPFLKVSGSGAFSGAFIYIYLYFLYFDAYMSTKTCRMMN